MTFLRRGPLGLKPPKEDRAAGLARRKALNAMSKKRKEYLQSQERTLGVAHMAAVAQLPCLVCGAWPVEVHHEGAPRSDFRVLPLCPQHHRREFGPGAYHYSKRAFYETHGDSRFLLAKVQDMLRGEISE